MSPTAATIHGAAGAADAVPADVVYGPRASSWPALLRRRLRGRCAPLLLERAESLPAASLWAMVRTVVRRRREVGIAAGARLALALPGSGTLAAALLAGLHEGDALLLLPPGLTGDEARELAHRWGAAALLVASEDAAVDVVPLPSAGAARPVAGAEAQDDVRLWLPDPSAARWLGLDDRRLRATVAAFLSPLPCAPARPVLTTLPWHHPLGLLGIVLPGLLAGATLVHPGDLARRDPAAARAALDAFDASTRWLPDPDPRLATRWTAAGPARITVADLPWCAVWSPDQPRPTR